MKIKFLLCFTLSFLLIFTNVKLTHAESKSYLIEKDNITYVADENEQISSHSSWYYINNNWYYTNTNGAIIKSQWLYINNRWYYVDNDGKMLTGLNQINNKYYYFNTTGIMYTGWKYIDNDWYYFSHLGQRVTNSWDYIHYKWYHFNSYGKLQTGWIYLKNKRYYLNTNGSMAIGWKYLNKKWYYFHNSGEMAKNWTYINKHWYNFNTNGTIYTGWKYSNQKWYYMNSDGSMAIGWKYLNNKWYYFCSNGEMAKQWAFANKHWYYLNSKGEMVTGWQYINKKWYYMNNDGSAKQNAWLYHNLHWYYFDENCHKVVNDYKIVASGRAYAFDSQGRMLVKEDSTFTNNGLIYHYFPAANTNYGKYRPITDVKAIVIHYTGNPKDTAWQNANYFAHSNTSTGAHFFVDSKGVYISTPIVNGSFSVGRLYNKKTAKYWSKLNNFNTINIEVACDKGDYLPTSTTINNTLKLTRYLKSTYGISLVVRHKDVCGKICPAYWSDDSKWKKEFLDKL